MPGWILTLILVGGIFIGFGAIIFVAIKCTDWWWDRKIKQDYKILEQHPQLAKMLDYKRFVEAQMWDERIKLTKLRDELESLKKQLSEAPKRYCKELEDKIEQTKETIYIAKKQISNIEAVYANQRQEIEDYLKEHNLELPTIAH